MDTFVRIKMYEPDGDYVATMMHPASWTASLPWNDVSALSMQYPKALEESRHLRGAKELALEVWDGTRFIEPPNARYRMLEISSDKAKGPADVVTINAPGYAGILDGIVVIPPKFGTDSNYDDEGKRKFLSASVGEIITTIINEARALVTDLAPKLTFNFSNLKDSKGNAWNRKVTIYYEPGLSLLTVLDNLANQGQCDWWFEGRELVIVNTDSTAAKRENVTLTNISEEFPVRSTFAGLLHTGFLIGEEETWQVVNDEATPSPWGRVMKVLTQGGVKDEGTAKQLIQAELTAGSRERIEYTHKQNMATAEFLPFKDFHVGDYVITPNRDDKSEEMRVTQLVYSYGSDGYGIALTLNDRFVDSEVRAAKRQKGIVNGASGDAGSGTIPDQKKTPTRPKAPTGVVADSRGYWNEEGQAKSEVTISWAPVTENIRNNGTTIDHYMVTLDGRVETTKDTSVAFLEVRPEAYIMASVVAIDKDNLTSSPSNIYITTEAPRQKLDPPTPLNLTVNNGIVTVTWDGLLDPGTTGQPYKAPAWFGELIIERSDNQSGPWVEAGNIRGGSLVVDTQDILGQTVYFRAYGVDNRRVNGLVNDPVSITVTSQISERIDRDFKAANDSIKTANDELARLDTELSGVSTQTSEHAAKLITLHNDLVTANQAATDAEAKAQEALDNYGPLDERTIAAQQAAQDAKTAAEAAETAAEAAQQKANDAYELANGKASKQDIADAIQSLDGTTTIYSTSDGQSGPPTTAEVPNPKVGDVFWRKSYETIGGLPTATVTEQYTYVDDPWRGKGWFAEKINSEIMANLDVNKLVVHDAAKMNTAVIDKIWADGINAKTINATAINVAPGNIYRDPKLTQQAEWNALGEYYNFNERTGTGYIFFPTDSKYQIAFDLEMGSVTPGLPNVELTPVKPGGHYVLSFDVTLSIEPGRNVKAYVREHPNVLFETYTGGSLFDIADYLKDFAPYQKTKVEIPVKIKGSDTKGISLYFSSHENFTGSARFENIGFAPQLKGVHIEPGGITAPNITFDTGFADAFWANSANFGKVSTEMFSTNAAFEGPGVHIGSDHIRIENTQGFLKIDPTNGIYYNLKSGGTPFWIKPDGSGVFKGSITSGSTITGTSFRTATTGQRIEITTYNTIETYDSSNRLTSKIYDGGMQFHYGTRKLGNIGESYKVKNPDTRGMAFHLEDTGDYMGFSYKETPTATDYTPIFEADPRAKANPGEKGGVFMHMPTTISGGLRGSTHNGYLYSWSPFYLSTAIINGSSMPFFTWGNTGTGIAMSTSGIYAVQGNKYVSLV